MYYLWLNEAQAGPFTLHQLQEMWNAGHITALTPYWQEGKPDWQLLHTIVSELEPESAPSSSEIKETVYIPQFEQKILRQMSTQADHRETAPTAPEAAVPVAATEEQILWEGHPTFWKWFWLLLVGILLTPVLVGLAILVPVFLIRKATRYAVTNRRVSLETGIFTKNSRELRLQDIRSIAAKRNFLGFGDIEFSTAASDDAAVIFQAVPHVEAVRDLVKKLQV